MKYGWKEKEIILKIGITLHVSSLPYSIFDFVKERGEVGEKYGCFTEQPSHALEFRSMGRLTHYCMSCSCLLAINIPFFHP